MLRLGEKQELTVVKKVEYGVYLSESKDSDERVLLPIKQVDESVKIGDVISVFIYLDSKDRKIATIREPLISLHNTAVLKVVNVGKIGAFVDWGLEKDLLLPFKEQTKRVIAGEETLLALYIDKSGRLAVTMKVYDYLENGAPYKAGDTVTGRVYQVSDNFGAFVAVDDKYSALIPKKEMYGDIKINSKEEFRVISVTDDGRLNLATRQKAYIQIEEDAKKILDVIEEFDGVLPFNDKASPETIRREFGMSKNEFKRAVGHLYKERQVEISEKSIRIIR
ncbi:MAG: S1-like domain-containing RNA-binding protein [Lachnospiraceae bacterium]|nr:S1-like domain-containing RNA-binding protein [Lachnospiraceae bacterium]